VLYLNLNEKFATLLTDNTKINIDKALQNHCKVVININNTAEQTLASKEQNVARKKLNNAQQMFFKDKGVCVLQEIFETRFDEKSITLR
jgi:hypothetical protein